VTGNECWRDNGWESSGIGKRHTGEPAISEGVEAAVYAEVYASTKEDATGAGRIGQVGISSWNESWGINKERPNGMRKIEVGLVVVYVDPVGTERNALVTAVWGELNEEKKSYPSLNLAFVSTDSAANDQYGRQMGRTSSCVGRQAQAAPGNYWKFVGE
jgi:hypothetical protein